MLFITVILTSLTSRYVSIFTTSRDSKLGDHHTIARLWVDSAFHPPWDGNMITGEFQG